MDIYLHLRERNFLGFDFSDPKVWISRTPGLPPPHLLPKFHGLFNPARVQKQAKKSKTKKRNWIPLFRSCLCFVFEKRIPNRDSRRILFSRFLSSRVMSGKKSTAVVDKGKVVGRKRRRRREKILLTRHAAASNRQSVGGVEEFKNASSVQAPQALLINNGVKKTFFTQLAM